MRRIEHGKPRLLEDERYLDDESLGRIFDAVILIGRQNGSQLKKILRHLKIQKGAPVASSTIIITGGLYDGSVASALLRILLARDAATCMNRFSIVGDIPLAKNKNEVVSNIALCILNTLIVDNRSEVIVSGDRKSLANNVEVFRNLILKNHACYGQIRLYAVPLPQEIE